MRGALRRGLLALTMLAAVLGFGVFDAPVSEAQGTVTNACSWENWWLPGGAPYHSWNVSKASCVDSNGKHTKQYVCDFHLHGILRQDMGGCNFWVESWVGLLGFGVGDQWNGQPSRVILCSNGGGNNAPCWSNVELHNESLPNAFRERFNWGLGIYQDTWFGLSQNWGNATHHVFQTQPHWIGTEVRLG